MKTMEQYDEMTKQAAYLIVQAISSFKDEPLEIQHQAHQIIMKRVQHMMHGDPVILEGVGLVTLIEEPAKQGT